MIVYHYHPATGEYVGSSPANESPLDPGVFAVPAHATTQAPSEPAAGHALVWRDGAWAEVPDHRGETWWTADRAPVVISALGDPELEDLSEECPPEPRAALIERRIAEARAKMAELMGEGAVTVETSAGVLAFGIDGMTQDNIQKALLGVLLGATPNPRPWTPKGATAPVSLSHDDLKAVGAAIGASVDAHMQAYLAHKAFFKTPNRSRFEIESRDINAGWPA